jgi:hypothetical protein
VACGDNWKTNLPPGTTSLCTFLIGSFDQWQPPRGLASEAAISLGLGKNFETFRGLGRHFASVDGVLRIPTFLDILWHLHN